MKLQSPLLIGVILLTSLTGLPAIGLGGQPYGATSATYREKD